MMLVGGPPHTGMKKKRRALKILGAIILLIVLLVALLPTILSLGPVRSLILDRANAEIDGTLDVKSWSLSWFKGPSVEGVDFDDGQGTRVRVDSCAVSCRPVDLLGSRKNLGEVVVRNPVVSVVLPAASGKEAGPAPGGVGGGGGKTPPRQPQASAVEPFRLNWDALGRARVEGGYVDITSKGSETSLQIKGLNADMNITSLNKPIVVKMTAESVRTSSQDIFQGDGSIELNAELSLFTDGVLDPDKIGVEASADISRLDLTCMNAFLGGVTNVEITSGILDAHASVEAAGDGVGSGKYEMKLSTDCRDLGLLFGKTNKIGETSVALRVTGTADIAGDRAAWDSLELISSPVTLSCTGGITKLSSSRVLDAGGKIKCDFARISELAAAAGPGVQLTIEGDEERDFSAHAELGGQGWVDILRTAEVEARLYIKRMEKFGIDAQDFDAVLEVRDAKAQATLKTSVNDGEMLIVPLVDVSGEKPRLGMPDDSQLLKGVKVNDAMLSELLALIHPVLRGCGVVGGRMDMSMERFGAPLDDTFMDGIGFNGAIQFKDLELGPGGLLKDIMSAAKLDVNKVAIPDQEITFKGEKGRITPSPLLISSKGHKITVRGSVGLDQTLSYVATVPVTEKMVSDKIYKYVKGASLELHIGGTVTKPTISKESMSVTLRNLVREASKNLVEEKGEKALGEKGKKLIDDLIKDEDKRKKAHDLLDGFLKKIK